MRCVDHKVCKLYKFWSFLKFVFKVVDMLS